jgi:hypothetical protein
MQVPADPITLLKEGKPLMLGTRLRQTYRQRRLLTEGARCDRRTAGLIPVGGIGRHHQRAELPPQRSNGYLYD